MELKPTESEMEVLQIMWDKEPCTVRDVHDVLEKTKDVGYTSTLKLMQIMFDKGMVKRDTTSRSHLYNSLISREQAQETALNKFIDTVFKGSSTDLIMKALGQHMASEKELDVITEYLNQFKQAKK
jgi:BlaI family transcriptional regulator, penicillinase repressor